jgi:dolichyl-phosphate beta-glucosyltransferase
VIESGPVGLVVPCFDEAARLVPAAFTAALTSMPWLHLCFVDDGSRDGTRLLLADLVRVWPERVTVQTHAVNRGKAEAVRTGVQALLASPTPWSWLGFWDADLATPFAELPGLCSHQDVDLVMGTRVIRLGAHVQRRWWRHLPARLMAWLVRQVLDSSVHDSQCGAKLFTPRIAGALVAEPFISRWLFDVELLARLRRMHGRRGWQDRVVEVPLGSWHDVRGSKLGVGAALLASSSLLRIAWRYRQAV